MFVIRYYYCASYWYWNGKYSTPEITGAIQYNTKEEAEKDLENVVLGHVYKL